MRKLRASALRRDDVAQEFPELAGRLRHDAARLSYLDGEAAEVRQLQLLLQKAAIGVRIGAHAAIAFGRERLELGNQSAVGVEQIFRLVAAHPVFENLQMRRILAAVRDRHLMRPPKTFDLLAVDFLGAGPALRAAQHDHRPARAFDALAAVAGVLLDRPDAGERDIQRVRHGLMHRLGDRRPRRTAARGRARGTDCGSRRRASARARSDWQSCNR
ncbi:hypothetical protein ACVWWO_007215 [Bradyrhizobium sp. F1.13.1]